MLDIMSISVQALSAGHHHTNTSTSPLSPSWSVLADHYRWCLCVWAAVWNSLPDSLRRAHCSETILFSQ